MIGAGSRRIKLAESSAATSTPSRWPDPFLTLCRHHRADANRPWTPAGRRRRRNVRLRGRRFLRIDPWRTSSWHAARQTSRRNGGTGPGLPYGRCRRRYLLIRSVCVPRIDPRTGRSGRTCAVERPRDCGCHGSRRQHRLHHVEPQWPDLDIQADHGTRYPRPGRAREPRRCRQRWRLHDPS